MSEVTPPNLREPPFYPTGMYRGTASGAVEKQWIRPDGSGIWLLEPSRKGI